MAKHRTKIKKKQSKSPFWEAVIHYSTSKRVHFVLGLLICFFTIYCGVALISFFFTGEADQSIVKDGILHNGLAGEIKNWAGIRGAYLADVFVDKWFGIPSFFLIFFFGSLGFRLMRLCRMHLFKRLLICLALTVWSSVFLAFVFSYLGDISFFHAGGLHGAFLFDLLSANIGNIGVILLLLVGLILIAVFLSVRTVPLLQTKLHFDNLRKKPADDDAEDENIATVDEKDEKEEEDNEEDEYEDKEIGDVQPEDDDVIPEKEPDEEVPFDIVAKDKDEKYDLSELGVYDPRLDLSSYKFPNVSLLKKYDTPDNQVDEVEQKYNKNRIIKTLADFGIGIVHIQATPGPTLTLYEVVPDKGVKVARIRSLEDDIALSLSAVSIRIIAPMPGKGTIGIEIPNKKPQTVSMESVISLRQFAETKYELPIILGRTIANDPFILDLAKMPHLLVAGATGQGKSVGLNVIITSLLYKKHPAELKFVLTDPKMVEFNTYEGIERHYLAKLPDMEKAIITDFENVKDTLKSLCKEMDNRYNLLTEAHVRNISEYNAKFINRHLNPEKGHKFMPYIVVIIDEFGDLIMTAGREIEMPIARIAQKARAVGIHMIIATQRPSTKIITGTIKANFPAKIAFKVSSRTDSQIILDSSGANKLIGRGDLLFSQGNDMTRVQCAFISTDEIEGIVKFIGSQPGFETAYKLPIVFDENSDGGGGGNSVDLSTRDPIFEDAARLIVLSQQGSTSLIQRKFSIGYNRAGRLMDQLEKAGIVGAMDGSKGRQVLIADEHALDLKLNN
ncbi:MAG: DNA translocase FtsK [Tannerella sp.]|jgi:S-DNA-T family DNA segregation ATPase FtsK/SpoIIIE|nr:DNA translocase FtsK [Tannerella sp.]